MSEREKLVLEFIKTYIQMRGFAPSYMDIALGLELKSKSNIHRIVHNLKKKGMLHVKPHLFRSLKLIDKSVDKMVSL